MRSRRPRVRGDGRVRQGSQRLRDRLEADLRELDIVTQNALIGADVALGAAAGDGDAHKHVWYVLEPQSQATCERLYGSTEVGSERELRDEIDPHAPGPVRCSPRPGRSARC